MFLLMYTVYIILMYFNRNIETWIVVKFPSLSHESVDRKWRNMETVVNSDDLVANNNELNQVDINTDETSESISVVLNFFGPQHPPVVSCPPIKKK